MPEKDIKVKVTSYEGYLIIETVNATKDENFVPAGGGIIGCVLTNTGKYLGMSHEAFALMKTIKKGGDDIGNLDTWESVSKGQCFAWLGPTKRLIEVSKASSSNKGIIDIEYIPIENKVPLDAFEAIIKSKAK